VHTFHHSERAPLRKSLLAAISPGNEPDYTEKHTDHKGNVRLAHIGPSSFNEGKMSNTSHLTPPFCEAHSLCGLFANTLQEFRHRRTLRS
jgi:hypothetical protein